MFLARTSCFWHSLERAHLAPLLPLTFSINECGQTSFVITYTEAWLSCYKRTLLLKPNTRSQSGCVQKISSVESVTNPTTRLSGVPGSSAVDTAFVKVVSWLCVWTAPSRALCAAKSHTCPSVSRGYERSCEWTNASWNG